MILIIQNLIGAAHAVFDFAALPDIGKSDCSAAVGGEYVGLHIAPPNWRQIGG